VYGPFVILYKIVDLLAYVANYNPRVYVQRHEECGQWYA
jgi:hypothetical protein